MTNQTLEFAYPSVQIEGEVSSFKINQNKFVFFDLKDSSSSINCFMMVFALRLPIEDGMKVVVTAKPKLTRWGKFSLTVQAIKPAGEGSLKKSFELLKKKLTQEGLFDESRKRSLPAMPHKIGVISSLQSAGYKDFITILDERWRGLDIEAAHVQVQGEAAPDQIINAITYFNEQPQLADILVIIRGGGSADDLAAFNDEPLVRAISASRIPTVVGVGHEIDTSLADMAADVRAATPSNAAQIIVPDRHDLQQRVEREVARLLPRMEVVVQSQRDHITAQLAQGFQKLQAQYEKVSGQLTTLQRIITQLDPRRPLRHGYALVRGETTAGSMIEIELQTKLVTAKVDHVTTKDDSAKN